MKPKQVGIHFPPDVVGVTSRRLSIHHPDDKKADILNCGAKTSYSTANVYAGSVVRLRESGSDYTNNLVAEYTVPLEIPAVIHLDRRGTPIPVRGSASNAVIVDEVQTPIVETVPITQISTLPPAEPPAPIHHETVAEKVARIKAAANARRHGTK